MDHIILRNQTVIMEALSTIVKDENSLNDLKEQIRDTKSRTSVFDLIKQAEKDEEQERIKGNGIFIDFNKLESNKFLPNSCVNGCENPEYCSMRDMHWCQKCKDW